MKKPVAIRIDETVLEAARECARRDNRTLTNFIETALRQRIATMAPLAPISMTKSTVSKDDARGA